MEQAINTDGIMELRWKWLLHMTYEDHFEIAHGDGWNPSNCAGCALAVLDTFGDDEPEEVLLLAWNPTTHERITIPMVLSDNHAVVV